MRKQCLLLLTAILCSLNVWAEKPSWVRDGDEWDSETSTLTVNSNPESQAYQYQADIHHVIFSDAVTNTGEGTFFNCKNLITVTIGNNVDIIGNEAFLQCDALTTVTMGNSVRVIGWGAFRSCYNLATIELPNSVTNIQSVAFEGCTSLTTFTIPKNVVEIQDQAFRDCTGVTDVYCYPQAANLNWSTTIWEFKGQYNGTSCHVLANQLSAYESKIKYISFVGDLFDPDPSVWVLDGDVWDADTKTLTVNSNPGDQAYFSNPLIQHVIISGTVTEIGIQAFLHCSALTTVTIPNSVESIGAIAFAACSNLTTVTIGNSVTSIGNFAFADCSSLASLTCAAATPPTLGGNVFLNVPTSTCTLYVPKGSEEVYDARDQWAEFTNIVGVDVPSEDPEEPIETIEGDYTINYVDKESQALYNHVVTLYVPVAPTITGFTFVKWRAFADDIEDGITIQAVYQADVPSSAPEVYTNPSNPAQKLIRNGNVYILTDDKTYTITGQEVK